MRYNCSKIIAGTIFIFLVLFILPRQAAAEDRLMRDLQSGDDAARLAAIEELGKINDSRSLAALIDESQAISEDWKIRLKAMDVVAASGAPKVADVLMDALTNACPAIKWHAAVGLGGYNGDARVADALIAALGDSTMFIREAAIESLGKIRASKAVPYLGRALRDSHFAIRLKAVMALERIGDQQSLSLLKWSADNESDPLIRDEAVSIVKRTAAGQGELLR